MIKPGSPGDKALKQLQRDDEYFKNLNKHKNWVGLSDDEREHFRKLGFVGVLAVENKLKEKNG